MGRRLVHHPDDPGGKTMYGVTQPYDQFRDSKGLKRRPVREITMAEALQVYYQQYWLPTAGR